MFEYLLPFIIGAVLCYLYIVVTETKMNCSEPKCPKCETALNCPTCETRVCPTCPDLPVCPTCETCINPIPWNYEGKWHAQTILPYDLTDIAASHMQYLHLEIVKMQNSVYMAKYHGPTFDGLYKGYTSLTSNVLVQLSATDFNAGSTLGPVDCSTDVLYDPQWSIVIYNDGTNITIKHASYALAMTRTTIAFDYAPTMESLKMAVYNEYHNSSAFYDVVWQNTGDPKHFGTWPQSQDPNQIKIEYMQGSWAALARAGSDNVLINTEPLIGAPISNIIIWMYEGNIMMFDSQFGTYPMVQI